MNPSDIKNLAYNNAIVNRAIIDWYAGNDYTKCLEFAVMQLAEQNERLMTALADINARSTEFRVPPAE